MTELHTDDVMCRLFDTMHQVLLGTHFKSNPRNIRTVIENGRFAMGEVGTLSSHVLSRFFNRYLFDHELKDESFMRQLYEQTRDKFLSTNAEGCLWNEEVHRLVSSDISQFNDADLLVRSILQRARNHCAEVLKGDIILEDLRKVCRDGPNGSYSILRNRSNIVAKSLSFERTERLDDSPIGMWCTHYFNESASFRIRDLHLLGDGNDIVVGSRMNFVPKNHKTFRTVAAEPVMNLRLQLGLGSMIQKALKKRAHIDLETQQDVHRNLVKIITRENLPLATVDWSEASDRIWYSLVEYLIPPGWFHLLDIARCDSTEVDGVDVPLSMFSTMGNGATFPLETLLFWALCVSCCDELGLSTDMVTVFGDDCIIPSKAFNLLNEVARSIGWCMNTSKSYSTGPFRESCGMDAYRGFRINGPRPQRVSLTDYPSTSILDHAQLVCLVVNDLIELLGDLGSITDILSHPAMLQFFRWFKSITGFRFPLVPLDYGTLTGIRISKSALYDLQNVQNDFISTLFVIPKKARVPEIQYDDYLKKSDEHYWVPLFLQRFPKLRNSLARDLPFLFGKKPKKLAYDTEVCDFFFIDTKIKKRRVRYVSECMLWDVLRRGEFTITGLYSQDIRDTCFSDGRVVDRTFRALELKNSSAPFKDECDLHSSGGVLRLRQEYSDLYRFVYFHH